MIVDFNRTIAYVCAGCGEVSYGDFSLFELSGNRGISVSCDCGRSSLKISYKTKKREESRHMTKIPPVFSFHLTEFSISTVPNNHIGTHNIEYTVRL